LFQSCAVYQKTPVTLEQASKQDLKATIETKSNETFLVRRILFEDGRFYGIQKVNGKKTKINLEEDKIKSIRFIKSNKVTYSLEQAAQKGRRVKIETKTNEILEFQRIVYKEGIQRVNGKKS